MFIPGIPMRAPFAGYGLSAYRGFGAVTPGQVINDANAVFAEKQINPSWPPSMGGIGVKGWIDLLHKAMDAGDLVSTLTITQALLPYTPEGPAEHETAQYQGLTPADVLREYNAANKWVSLRPNAFNEQFGPGYSHATVTGPDAADTREQVLKDQDAAAAAAAKARADLSAKRRADFVKDFEGLGYAAGTITAELARLDALFGNDWSNVDGSPWNYVGPQFIDAATGTIKKAASAAPPAAPDLTRGRYIINGRIIENGVDIGPAPSASGGVDASGNALLPSGSSEPPVATETNNTQLAGFPVSTGVLVLGVVVGALVLQGKKRPRGYTSNRRR